MREQVWILWCASHHPLRTNGGKLRSCKCSACGSRSFVRFPWRDCERNSGGWKAQRTEAVPIRTHWLFHNPFADQARRDGCEQDSTPEVSRGNQQAVDVGRAEYGKVIGRIGTQACPGFFKARICEARCKIDGR